MHHKINSNYVYLIICANILLFYFLFAKTQKNVFLILFLVEWIGFTIYGYVLILYYLIKK